MVNSSVKLKRNVGELLRIAFSLLIICTVVSAVVSTVYAFTHEKYLQNLLEQKQNAISSLFDGAQVECEPLPTEGTQVEELYRVLSNGSIVGYCANVKSSGFGGDINMMIAISPDGSMRGVKIVSMSETPGLGSRTGEEEYLSQYANQTFYGSHNHEPLVLGEDIDAISGATISSRAVLSGVNTALDALLQYIVVEVE